MQVLYDIGHRLKEMEDDLEECTKDLRLLKKIKQVSESKSLALQQMGSLIAYAYQPAALSQLRLLEDILLADAAELCDVAGMFFNEFYYILFCYYFLLSNNLFLVLLFLYIIFIYLCSIFYFLY
jgi:hypothetical protein